MDVPNGLSPETAALTEPMAVAWHAVRRSGVRKRETAVVVGCGPIGLAVILMLKARGVRTVIASDFSPGRRALAEVCGADVVIDPGAESPWTSFEQSRYITDANQLFDLALDTMGKLRRVPMLPWWQVLRAAEAAGATPTGRWSSSASACPGIIDQIINERAARVAGRRGRRVHGAGHDPAGDGDQQGDRPAVRVRLPAARVPRDPAPDRRRARSTRRRWSPARSGSTGSPHAFDALGDPERHAKILIDPATRRPSEPDSPAVWTLSGVRRSDHWAIGSSGVAGEDELEAEQGEPGLVGGEGAALLDHDRGEAAGGDHVDGLGRVRRAPRSSARRSRRPGWRSRRPSRTGAPRRCSWRSPCAGGAARPCAAGRRGGRAPPGRCRCPGRSRRRCTPRAG